MHFVHLATMPTGKLRMKEGTEASRRTTNMCIRVYVAFRGLGFSSVGTLSSLGREEVMRWDFEVHHPASAGSEL